MFSAPRIALCLALMATTAWGGNLAIGAQLAGGASNLTEKHGDWTVNCAVRTQPDNAEAIVCAFSQQQFAAGQTRQRALAIELRPDGSGVKGTLALPFGLALEPGVTYQLDEGQSGAAQYFRTCLPIGCLIDIAFDSQVVASLKVGDALKVKAVADGGQQMMFSISLNGFSSAHDRVLALMAN